MNNITKNLRSVFLMIYFVSGIYIAFGATMLYRNLSPNNTFSEYMVYVLYFTYLMLPLVVSIMGLISLKRKKNSNVYIWVCACYWLVLSVSELMEGNKFMPNLLLIIFMSVISVISIVLLLVQKSTKSIS